MTNHRHNHSKHTAAAQLMFWWKLWQLRRLLMPLCSHITLLLWGRFGSQPVEVNEETTNLDLCPSSTRLVQAHNLKLGILQLNNSY